MEFKKGTIVKSKDRTENHPLFLMVLIDPSPSKDQFNAVVLADKSSSRDFAQGSLSNAWNTSHFEKSSWIELKKFI